MRHFESQQIRTSHVDGPFGRWTQTEYRPSHLAGVVEGIWYFDGFVSLPRERVFPNGMLELSIQFDEPHHQAEPLLPGRYPPLCATGLTYGWSARTVGFVLAVVGVASMIVQAGLVGSMVKRLGEYHAMLAGFAFGALAFVIYALAPSGTWSLVGIPIGALFGFAYPALQGLMTRRVGPDEQGRLQGAVASLIGIAGVIAPVLFTQLFAQAIGRFRGLGVPGAPFLLAALLLVTAMIVASGATARAREEDSTPSPGLETLAT